jgi:hypothetical protein
MKTTTLKAQIDNRAEKLKEDIGRIIFEFESEIGFRVESIEVKNGCYAVRNGEKWSSTVIKLRDI